MMHHYQFFGSSYYRKSYPHYSYRQPLHNCNNFLDLNERTTYFPRVLPNTQSKNFDYSTNASNSSKNNNSKFNNADNNNNNMNMKDFQSDNNEFFEIFGLKLYFDDLLIIALLFFLYQEDVKDTYLYIALILLLLS